MLFLLFGIFLTVCFGAAILVLMASDSSKSQTRLMQIVSLGSRLEPGKVGEDDASGGILATVTKLAAPFRGVLGGKNDNTVRQLALAGSRDPRYADLFFASKLLLPAILIAASAVVLDGPGFPMLVLGIAGFYAPGMWLSGAI